MPESPEKPILRPNSIKPDGFWSTPGGAEGLSGSVDGVLRLIDSIQDADMPSHHKNALKENILADIEGTDFNYVQVCAQAARNKTETDCHTVGHFDIRTSKKIL